MSAERVRPTPEQEETLAGVREAHIEMKQARARRRSKVREAREEGECTWPMIAEQLDMTPRGAAKILPAADLK